jgi:lysophospholipase L1-like esterase
MLIGAFLVFSSLSCKKEKENNVVVDEQTSTTASTTTSSTSSNSTDTIINDTVSVIKKIKYLALGDSYTIGASVSESENYPNILVKRLNDEGIETEKFQIIAQTGWTTYDLDYAISQANPSNDYNLVSLLIGVNNQYQRIDIKGYRDAFPKLLNKASGFAGGNKNNVFVISIPDYGYTPFGASKQSQISPEIDAYNQINDSVTKALGIKYYNITPISRNGLNTPNLVAIDGLHPSGIMYKLWVDLFYNDIKLLY